MALLPDIHTTNSIIFGLGTYKTRYGFCFLFFRAHDVRIKTTLIRIQAYAILFCGWSGGFNKAEGTLLPIEEVGQIMKSMSAR